MHQYSHLAHSEIYFVKENYWPEFYLAGEIDLSVMCLIDRGKLLASDVLDQTELPTKSTTLDSSEVGVPLGLVIVTVEFTMHVLKNVRQVVHFSLPLLLFPLHVYCYIFN